MVWKAGSVARSGKGGGTKDLSSRSWAGTGRAAAEPGEEWGESAYCIGPNFYTARATTRNDTAQKKSGAGL